MSEKALVDAAHRISKPASEHTQSAQRNVSQSLDFSDRQSFEDASRGFIASLDGPATIRRPNDNKVVFDLEPLSFLSSDEPPPTVNPSLWRQAQLTTQHRGLYEVVPGLYQWRSFDIANMTLIQGKTGWIIVDPLTATETARAGLEVANRHLGVRPVVAVLFTHSHADHIFGINGVASPEDCASGKVQVIAPQDFVHEALAENVLAGPAMLRRGNYMYGHHLPRGASGFVTTGLGPAVAQGSVGFAPPNDIIEHSGERRTIDGVEIEFLMTMGSEAPSEFCFYLPQLKALCMSEITSQHLHNLYTPRGAQVRDSFAWSLQIQAAIDAFGGDVEVEFASHHWPIWGKQRVVEYLEKQRDLYKYIHDETLRFAAHGLNAEECAERLSLPDSLAKPFFNRPYYGNLFANVRAVYNRYLGFFDGNPANLHPLPPTALAPKFVEYMGGPEALLRRARSDYDKGEYRWVATVLNHLVMSAPTHQAARALLADAYEQMGYQAESAPWRNFYLSGAMELRGGLPSKTKKAKRRATLSATMPVDNLFQALAIRLNGEKAADCDPIAVNIHLEDAGEDWVLSMKHGVLWHQQGKRSLEADVSLYFPSQVDFRDLIAGEVQFKSLLRASKCSYAGDISAFAKLFSMMDKFPVRFPIVTPKLSKI